jgi:acetyl esterase/lipase
MTGAKLPIDYIRRKYSMKFIYLLIIISSVLPAAAQDTTSYSRTEIIYGRKDGMALTMVEISPKQHAKGKAIVSLVSGNWISNYRNELGFERQATTLTDAGYTVFLVMHGSQPRYSIPDEISDIKRSVRFIRYNAKDYHIDPDHIGITGSSSGGHLSLMVALADDKINSVAIDPVDKVSSRVQAAAVFFPPTDFLNWGTPNSGADYEKLRRFGVAGAFDFKELSMATGMYEHIKDSAALVKIAKEVSPMYAVSADDPPVFIAHGDADPIVPLQQSQSIIEKLKTAGVPCELMIHPGGGHGWHNSEVEEKKFAEWFDKYL